MKRANVIAFIVLLVFGISAPVLSFESATSYSFFRLSGLESGVSSHVQLGLISSSFSDCFARIASIGTQTDLRFLEAKRPPDRAAIDAYVDNHYAALPADEREKFKAELFKTKVADEELKAKMASPILSDEEKLMFAQERERLLRNTWEYEGELIDKYSQSFKPGEYARVNTEISSLEGKREEQISCIATSTCSIDDSIATLRMLDDQATSLIVGLMQSPTEVDGANKNALNGYMSNVGYARSRFGDYLKNLYSR